MCVCLCVLSGGGGGVYIGQKEKKEEGQMYMVGGERVGAKTGIKLYANRHLHCLNQLKQFKWINL